MTNPKAQATLFPGAAGSVVLTDQEIQGYVGSGLLIEKVTFDPRFLQSCSYDVRVGKLGILGGQGQEIDLEENVLELSPGAYAGLVSFEKINLPLNVFARIGSKRSLSYDGMILLTGSLVDPGYTGHLLFGVYNASQKKAIIRSGMKICSIVFEQLPSDVERKVHSDPDLLHGSLPQDFLARMANMEVLPWMQISERVKDIERITKDIIDLKARYEDVLQPIKKLTENIDRVSTDVSSLAQETRSLTHELDTLRGITSENAKQIGQLATTVGAITGELKGVAERSRKAEDSSERQEGVLTELRTKFGRFSLAVYIFWAILLLAVGALIPKLIEKIFGH
jgi:deoxycytidine triphosphate deaminase